MVVSVLCCLTLFKHHNVLACCSINYVVSSLPSPGSGTDQILQKYTQRAGRCRGTFLNYDLRQLLPGDTHGCHPPTMSSCNVEKQHCTRGLRAPAPDLTYGRKRNGFSYCFFHANKASQKRMGTADGRAQQKWREPGRVSFVCRRKDLMGSLRSRSVVFTFWLRHFSPRKVSCIAIIANLREKETREGRKEKPISMQCLMRSSIITKEFLK